MVARWRNVLWLTLALALCSAVQGKGSPEKDRDILVKFRDSIKNWAVVKAGGNLQGWDDATPAYLWSGVVLDFELRVREVNLPCFDFMFCTVAQISAEAPVFAELAHLDHLELLHLGGNNITGELPDAWAALGTFPALQSLSLSSARLSGTLPRSWGAASAFPALKMLLLDQNQLRGSLPVEWGAKGAFASLEQLVLEDNSLSGALPVNWGQSPSFPRLQTLGLAGSGLGGSLPPGWGADGGFSALQTLSLARCGFQGALPPEWAAPSRFPKLNKIELQGNELTGGLPSEWGCKHCFPALAELILLNNSLSGSLPDSWGMLGALRMLDVSGNRLEGQLPGGWAVPGALPQLATLSLGSNSLGGTLPGAWGDPRALPALSWLDASHNNISGTLPGQWGAPNSFPRLRLLYLQHNNLSGPLPSNWSFNSTLQQLFTLSLAHNHFTGNLPNAWGATDNSLAALYILDVGFNQLDGLLPANWGTSRSALSSLTSITIAGNNFTGEIPPNWGLLQDMHYLVLAPGNPTVCRPLPYVGQFVTCYGEDSATCQEPVQLRSNCSSDLPGWVPYAQQPRDAPGLTGLQIGLIAAGASLVAACGMLTAVLVLRWQEARRWQTVKGLDAELALRGSTDPLADLIAAAAARKRGRGQHSALATKLLKECAIDHKDVMFCRGPDGNLVQLGAGAYGQVYKAFLYGVHPVAVKVFQTQDDVPADDFWREISILRTCRHGNIVQFQGACVDGDTTMMVTELLDTDLYRALQLNRVNWYKHGLDIAIDVAQALHFLHCRNIIHFDCKSPNILLSTTNSAKLADVGWAQILYHSYITGDGGTFNWAAPEQLIGLKCTAKADVYSYGLVLWELCTRELPVRGQIRDIKVPQEAPQMAVDLVRECLDVDPAKRPTMEQIIHRLMEEKARMAAEADTTSGASSSPSPSMGAAQPARAGSNSSLGLRGLDGLPGTSMHSSSGSGSAFNAGTSSGHQSGHSGGSRLWAADSSNGSGSGPGARPGSASGGSNSHAGHSDSRASTIVGASLGTGTQPSFDGMPVGGRRGLSINGSTWNAGSSTQDGSQTSGSGSADPFLNSPWLNRASLAESSVDSDSGDGSRAGPSIFEGSAWAAGRPTLALAAAGSSAGGFAPGRLGGGLVAGPMPFSPAGPAGSAPPAPTLVAPTAAAGPQGPSIFADSPWFAGNPFAAASVARGGSSSSGDATKDSSIE